MYLTNLTLPEDARDTVTINDQKYIERELRNLPLGAFFVLSRFDNEGFIEEVPLDADCLAFHVYTICEQALAGLIFTAPESPAMFHGYFYKVDAQTYKCVVAVNDSVTQYIMRKHFPVLAS